MRDTTHMPADHPKIPAAKVGVLIANLGTPDNYDYWSMRRYLNEFLSDKRVIDYPAWKWQPILQGIILSIRPFKSGAAYKSIWNEEKNESPLMTITKAQTARIAERLALWKESPITTLNITAFDIHTVRTMAELIL